MNSFENSETEALSIEGSVENIVYRSGDNGYTVFELLLADAGAADSSRITCTAYLPEITEGEVLRLTGNFIMHPSYGRQFGASSALRSGPTTLPGMIKYLSSSIKGIGERTAMRITEKFGADIFNIIENHPDKLASVKGISLEKAIAISAQFSEQNSLRSVMMRLQEFGISPAFIQKIYKRYKEGSVEIIKKNPYLLADEIIGIGFKTADAIASRAGLDPASEFRVKAGIKYILREEAMNGHVYLEKNLLTSMASELMDISEEAAANGLMALQLERQVFQEPQDEHTAVYLNKYFYAESYTAKRLIELSQDAADISGKSFAADISSHEEQAGIELAPEQKTAVKEAMSSGVLVITGGPGTGKTTIINAIISLLKKRGLAIELAAPTGRAAKRMEEASGTEAKTIHRLIGMTGGEAGAAKPERDEENPVEADAVIIDESSMVDISLMYALLKAIPRGARLILAGDADQLPSVGPGNVLKDIINSGEIKVVKLTEIFRQSRESAIVMNAHRIKAGKRPVYNEDGRGFYILRRRTAEQVTEILAGLVRDRLPKYSGANPMTDIQVLTPMRKGGLGAGSLNSALQRALNPASPRKREKEYGGFVYREGDKVMQIKNNYSLAWEYTKPDGTRAEGSGIYNGDMGVITRIDDGAELLRVVFDGGRAVDYAYARLDELEPAYAITIHKSQGSEYRVVVIPLLGGPPLLMTRNLLYTAVTRAKELVVILGSEETLARMVDNNKEVNRFSALSYRLKRLRKLMGNG
ncbi:MAG: ATP-dependent RecD-like DNA helicase [Clostridiales bacterium]|jgi:exodeoxyribonuclease V alpha subunit|nr:ATP-dependent RecD-like DNA helicase [Clostridiales bacterium]